MKKPIWMDKYWEKSELCCPLCANCDQLYKDTHTDRDASHYCLRCRKGMIIMTSQHARNSLKGTKVRLS